jgi:hypothetical protein
MKIKRKIRKKNLAGRIYYSIGIPRAFVDTVGTREVELDIGREDIVIRPLEEEGCDGEGL